MILLLKPKQECHRIVGGERDDHLFFIIIAVAIFFSSGQHIVSGLCQLYSYSFLVLSDRFFLTKWVRMKQNKMQYGCIFEIFQWLGERSLCTVDVQWIFTIIKHCSEWRVSLEIFLGLLQQLLFIFPRFLSTFERSKRGWWWTPGVLIIQASSLVRVQGTWKS